MCLLTVLLYPLNLTIGLLYPICCITTVQVQLPTTVLLDNGKICPNGCRRIFKFQVIKSIKINKCKSNHI
uniref:CTCK domain-containing protein n=1 Tax=Anguilla anguilla TaxID=7936 RepID=A0A0E9R0E7_ANGAN